MKSGRGRNKGHKFERTVANLLTQWSSRKFKRVPKSGGWDKDTVTGDVFCVDEYHPEDPDDRILVPFSWECKCAESWDFTHFFTETTKSSLCQWWQQASADAAYGHKLPALIFTKNYQPVFIMLYTNTLNKLSKIVGSSWKKFPHVNCSMLKNDKVAVLLLADFLSWIEFDLLLNLTS